MLLDRLPIPIVLAPLGGGPSTPELAAAVTGAGGLGSLAAGYLSAEALAERIAATRALTGGAIAVNVFTPAPASPERAYRRYVDSLAADAARADVEVGTARHDDDDWAAKLELLERDPVAAVSFTFGCPPADVVARLRQAGSEVWVTATAPDEAREAEDAGADALVVQGGEAGGHRASFVDRERLPVHGLLSLLQLVAASTDLPLVASGGIATGAAIAAVLAAGARAAQLGTAFMRCPEAGTAPVHRRALATSTPTRLTRAFTGRLARGIDNRFIDEHDADAPIAYPEVHHATAPLRAAGRRGDDPDLVNLWAGETHELARELPAAELVATLAADARAALAAARGRLSG